MSLRGSCLCGAVRYALDATALGAITTCYCSRCRKSHGAERRLRGRVEKSGFRWLSGEDQLACYAVSERRDKLFCSRCGTPILNVDEEDESTYGLAVATLDEDPGHRNLLHLFAASRPEWIEIRDDLPSFDTVPDIRGRVVAVGDDTVSIEPAGATNTVTIRVKANREVRAGDVVRAHLGHDEGAFEIELASDEV